MSIQLISVSHQYASLDVRECFAFSKESQKKLLMELKEREEIEECILVSTCNRTELYCYGNDAKKKSEVFAVMQQSLLEASTVGEQEKASEYLRFYQDQKASHHLFQVAAGLDSMVIGEDQILGQVKDAYELAHKLGTTGVYLNTLFRYAVTGAKKVKTETNLSKTPVSTASLAIKMAMQELGTLDGKKVMIIGASGKIGSIVLKNLQCEKQVQIYATTRKSKVNHHGLRFEAIPYEERYAYMDEMDVIVSATSSPHYTVTKSKLQTWLTTKKKRVLVDLAVPMDIEASIQELDETICYNIDDFHRISKENNEKKMKEALEADLILEDYETKYEQWRIFKNSQAVMDTVCMSFAEEGQRKGVEHVLRKLFYQIRDTASPEQLDIFFQCLEERNQQWAE